MAHRQSLLGATVLSGARRNTLLVFVVVFAGASVLLVDASERLFALAMATALLAATVLTRRSSWIAVDRHAVLVGSAGGVRCLWRSSSGLVVSYEEDARRVDVEHHGERQSLNAFRSTQREMRRVVRVLAEQSAASAVDAGIWYGPVPATGSYRDIPAFERREVWVAGRFESLLLAGRLWAWFPASRLVRRISLLESRRAEIVGVDGRRVNAAAASLGVMPFRDGGGDALVLVASPDHPEIFVVPASGVRVLARLEAAGEALAATAKTSDSRP